jgi:hypothetical protein
MSYSVKQALSSDKCVATQVNWYRGDALAKR